MFIYEGYAALTISNVAKKANITSSHLKYYFPDIDDLIDAMYTQLLELYESTLQEEVFNFIGKEPPDKVIDRLLKTHIGIIKQLKNDLVFAETVAFTARNEKCRRTLDEWITWYTDNVSALVRAVNPKMSRNRSYRVSAIILVLLDNAQRFLGEGKTNHKFKGLEKEIKLTIKNLVMTDGG